MEPDTGSRIHVPIPPNGLTTVVEPAQSSLDIVFVHGFTGHPERTWAKAKGDVEHGDDDESSYSAERPPKMRRFNILPGSKSSGGHGYRSVFWPRDVLPVTAPNARIMTYGYDTHIRHWIGPEVSHNTVYDIAWDFLVSLEASRRTKPTTPIILIAHSLGGIVVKEMLRRSSMCRLGQSHLHSVFDSTRGIVFFGTPHGGSDPRGFLQSVAERLIKAVGFTVNEQIVSTLLPSSERLRELRDEFAPMARRQGWAVHSFQEQMGIKPLGGRKVVDDTSSYLNAPDLEVTEHIGQNHMDMCRFTGSHDPEYRKVAAAIGRIMSKKGKTATDQVHAIESGVDHKILQKILDSLRFDQHDARHQNIKSAHAKTCKWLLKSDVYSEWVKSKTLEEHHGFFWMKGKPGTGKSTIMKFLFANARRTMKGNILLSFFFNARGHSLEQSAIGMYRSLLLQLLEQKPSLQSVLGFGSSQNNLGWSLELLKSLFEQAIQSLEDTPVVCFIDALDECPETEVREMVSSFSHLGQLAASAGHHLRVCFSSRHYPYITINKKLELILEEHEGHHEDISQYVASELKIGNSKLADEIRQTVETKSSGIFMWVVLVVQILNKEYDSGHVHRLRRRLKEIPKDLHDLFREILTRDSRNGEELILCLQWVLFARSPLTPVELYYAVLSGVDHEAVGDSNLLDLSNSDFDRYILDCSKGLIEITKSKNCTAQFIHESVRDFLLKENGFISLVAEDNSHSFEALSQEKLKQCCLVHMEMAKSVNESASLPAQFPFLPYAINNIMYHAERAEELGAFQNQFLAEFQTKEWVALSNSCERFRAREYPLNARLLYILAEKNLPHLIAIHPTISSYLDMGEERYTCPLYAALAMGSYEAAKALLWPVMQKFPPSHEAPLLFKELFSQKKPWRAFPRDFKFHKKEEFYQRILEISEELMIFVLSAELMSQKDLQTVGYGLFEAAIRYQRELFIIALLKREDHLRSVGNVSEVLDSVAGWRNYPLHQAAMTGLPRVAKFLLETRGVAEVNNTDTKGATPMTLALIHNHGHVVKVFLEFGAAVNYHDASWALLSMAKWKCDASCHCIKILLTMDVGVNAVDGNGNTPLIWAVIHDNTDAVKLLLDSGKADLDAKDKRGRTALLCACSGSNAEIVKLLLESGKANLDYCDNRGRTALSYAYSRGKTEIIQLLLDSGKAGVDT